MLRVNSQNFYIRQLPKTVKIKKFNIKNLNGNDILSLSNAQKNTHTGFGAKLMNFLELGKEKFINMQKSFKANFSRRDSDLPILNFRKVDEFLYRGGQPELSDFEVLSNKYGIKTVINLRAASPEKIAEQKAMAEKFGIKYINFPMLPNKPPTRRQIAEFLSITLNEKNGPAYLHCLEGKDRTGLMTAIYKFKKYGTSYPQLLAEMITCGYHSKIFGGQKKFLLKYTG